VLQHAPRILKCMKECFLHRKDAGSVISTMTLERCVRARTWHDTPTILRQLRGIGITSVRLLAMKGVKTFQHLQQIEPEELEVWFNRSTPFGRELLKDLERIPRYKLAMSVESKVGDLYIVRLIGIGRHENSKDTSSDICCETFTSKR
jgi:ATP-dependent DNA helicase HFM1/MER3